MNATQNYRLISAKGCRTIVATKREAIKAAIMMEEQLQPAFGVCVENESGSTVTTVKDGKVEN